MMRSACVALVFLLSCGSFNRSRATARRVAPRAALRVPPAARGLDLAADPTPAPTAAMIFGEGLLAGISDGEGATIDDQAARPGEVAWLTARLERGGDDREARTLLAIRRAAFGAHVPASAERRELDNDVLEDRGMGIDADAIALVGPNGPCLARRAPAVVTALSTGGHSLDVRWPLLDCGPGPWAPVGVAAHRIPTTLRWVPPQCDERPEIREAWASAGAPEAGRLGAIWDGDALVALVGEGTLWLPGPDGWRTRGFAMAGVSGRECPSTVADVVDETDPGDADVDPGDAELTE